MRLTIAACLLLAAPAYAQDAQPCDTRAAVVAQLSEEYGETLQSYGMAAGNVVEMWASDQPGTWTLLQSSPEGQTCMIGSGDGYVARPTPAKPKGAAL